MYGRDVKVQSSCIVETIWTTISGVKSRLNRNCTQTCLNLPNSMHLYLNNNINLPKIKHPNSTKPYLRTTLKIPKSNMLRLVGKTEDRISNYITHSHLVTQSHKNLFRTCLNLMLALCQGSSQNYQSYPNRQSNPGLQYEFEDSHYTSLSLF